MKCAVKSAKFVKDLQTKIENGKLTENQVTQILEQLDSKEFKEWYGKGEVDSFGYPKLIDNLWIINEHKDKIKLYDLQNSESFEKATKINDKINDLVEIKKFLNEQAIGLQKRISAYKGSKYAEELQELLSEIDSLHENQVSEALTLHTKYILETIKKFETRLYNYQDTNVDNLNEEQLKDREEKYFSFLLQAKQFTETFEKITQLPKPVNKNNKLTSILNQLRHSEAKVSDLRKTLENETNRIWSTRLKEMSTNPDIVSGALDFLAAQEDETGAQRWLDALADSHHPVLATLSKKYRRQMEYARLDAIKLTNKWNKFCEDNNLKTEQDFKKFADKEGRFIQKYDYKGYYNSLNEVRQPLKNLEEQGKKFKEDGKTLTAEYKKLVSKYYEWKRLNTSPVKDSKNFIPNEKWINPEYAKLSKIEVNQLNEIQSFLFDLVKHTNYEKTIKGEKKIISDNMISEGYFPAIPKNTATTKDGKKIIADENNEKIITEAGDIVRFIPFKYIKKLNQTALKNVDASMSEEEIKAIEEENKQIKQQNKLNHAEAVNYNLYEVMETFIKTATNNRRKLEMKLDVDATVSQFKLLKLKQKSAKGNTYIDKIASKATGNTVEFEKDAVDSNAYKHLLDWVEGVFYDEFNLDEGALTEWTTKIQNVSSVLGIGFNALSAINNKIVGNIQLKMEAAGKQYFNYKELTDARKTYFLSQLNFIEERNKDKSKTLVTGLVKFFDILQTQDELVNGKASNLKESMLHKLRMAKDMAYFMQHIGEHQIQNTALLTLLNSHRIIDGKIMSYFEYSNKFDISAEVKKMEEEGKSKEEITHYINTNKKDEKTLRQEFEQYNKLIDEFELIDGHAELKKTSTINDTQIADFRHKVIGINQKLHGIYNVEDGAMIQRYALGRLGMQFRKWIPNAWNRRFGSKFNKSYWNERRGEFNEGMYISTFKYIAKPFTKSFKQYREEQQNVAISVFKAFFKGLKDTITNAKINWHSLNAMEKANVKRTMLEATLLISAVLIGSLLKGDDDDEKNMLITWGLYECDRLYGELSTFAPWGVLREGNRLFDNPLASFRTFDAVSKLTWNTVMYPIREDDEREFKSGIYHGRDKVSVYFLNTIPIINQIQKISYLSENNQRYSMFK